MKLAFTTAAKYISAIWEGEDALGLHRSPVEGNMRKLDIRWRQIEKLRGVTVSVKSEPTAPATLTPTPKVAPVVPAAAPIAVTKPAPVALPVKLPEVKLTGMDRVYAAARADLAKIDAECTIPRRYAAATPTLTSNVSREKLQAILKIAQPTADDFPDKWNDEECRLETERACFQAHLSFPQFMRTDAELSDEYWRRDKPQGARLYLQAEAKRRISELLTKTK